jgi:type IV fimbrial biogenesis protein FimT
MKRVNGFTLLELIVTMTILVITLTLGIPSLHQWIQRSKTTNLQYTLLHSIHYARTQAIQLQSTITVCSGVRHCEDDWGSHVIIFNDLDSNGVLGSNEPLLKYMDIGVLGEQLDWRSFRRKPYLQFDSRGLTRALNGTFHFCPSSSDKHLKFAIILSRTGRARIGDTPNC